MKVKFWGTRGSIPVSPHISKVQKNLKEVLLLANGRTFADGSAVDQFLSEIEFPLSSSYGGNTSCVQVDLPIDTHVLFDCGTGLRDFGQSILSKYGTAPQHYKIFMSHCHWDHIMGFPFFTPAYIPGNKIDIYGCHTNLQAAFLRQQSEPCFPIYWDQLAADITVHTLTPDECFTTEGFAVTPILQPHQGDSYGYRLESDNHSVVYSTDGEHTMENVELTNKYVAFIQGADLVIFDAMYSMAASMTLKQDWGHSSNMVGLDLCRQANAKHYCMFHHEPIHDDSTLHQILTETRRYRDITSDEGWIEISSAYDGLEITL
jgi:phosphoribosyl 1,2-cyclic phosphodiesterase